MGGDAPCMGGAREKEQGGAIGGAGGANSAGAGTGMGTSGGGLGGRSSRVIGCGDSGGGMVQQWTDDRSAYLLKYMLVGERAQPRLHTSM
jgi:hypothetical protein